MKDQILAAIGETGLQPAASLNAGLAANDRIKYAFSLLQMAIDHAEHPEQPVASLRQERIGCGIDDPDLDTLMAEARMVGEACRVPGATRIFARIGDDMRLMAAPVLTAHSDGFATRVEALLGSMPATKDDLIDPAATSAMMQAGHGKTDSLHRLWSWISTSNSMPCRGRWPRRRWTALPLMAWSKPTGHWLPPSWLALIAPPG
jgi:hypothetical protein